MKYYFYYTVCFFIIFFSSAFNLKADDNILKGISPDRYKEYTIRLVSGDILTGTVVEMINDPDDGEGIKFKTSIGNALIFANQIVEINLKEDYYRHSHRVFLLPSAQPIKDNYFIGDFEMLFLYAGIGISDFFSLTAGRTIIPGIPSRQQISAINAKFTIFNSPIDTVYRGLSLAVGGNLGYINSANRMIHLYGVGTFSLSRTDLSATVFYKMGGEDFFDAFFSQNSVLVRYPNGSIGIGLGMDNRLLRRNDIHIIGELWNSDVTRPTNTAVLLGVRLANTSFSADFGLAFFTQPFAAPFASFVWTPF